MTNPMKRIRTAGSILILMLVLTSCLGKFSDDQKEEEQRLLRQYLVDNDITTDPKPSGLYYIPIQEGIGNQPNASSWVEIEYTIQLVSGYIFSTTDEEVARENYLYSSYYMYGPARVELSGVIPGLQEGLQYMKEGGEATLIIPSDLAYGGMAFPGIPQYSTLIYDLKLIKTFDDPVQHESEVLNDYLENLAGDPFVTPTGVYFLETGSPEGDFFTDEDTLDITYTGMFPDGRVFDSNVGGTPLTLTLPATNVVPGFNDGFYLTRHNSDGIMIIPWDQAYGVEGRYESVTGQLKIPPYQTLIFEVHVERH